MSTVHIIKYEKENPSGYMLSILSKHRTAYDLVNSHLQFRDRMLYTYVISGP